MFGWCLLRRVSLVLGVLSSCVTAGGFARAQPTAGFPAPVEAPPPPPQRQAPSPVLSPTPAPPAPPPAAASAAPAATLSTPPAPIGAVPSVVAAPQPAPSPPEYAGELAGPRPVAVARRGLPPILPYRDGLPVPAGYHVESRASGGLVATGLVTLGAAYAAAIGFAFSEDFENGTGWVVVPVAGPWAAMGSRSFSCRAQTVPEARKCFDGAYSEATTLAVFAVDGVVQAVGLALTIAGLSTRSVELVRNDIERLKVTASAGPDGRLQLGLRGAF